MKNINIVNKVIAKKVDKPLHVVAAINSHYWKTSRDKLVKAEPTTIFWKHIGSITISKYKVYSEIRRFIKKIKTTRVSEKYSQEGRERILRIAYERLTMLLKHRNNIAQDEYDQRIREADGKRMEESSAHTVSDTDND
jgi:hypothetical protein